MLPYVLSSPPARLLRTGLVLKDAGRKHHTLSGIDEVVIHEPFDFADNGQKALIHLPNHFACVGHALVAPYRYVHHRFRLPPYLSPTVRTTQGRPLCRPLVLVAAGCATSSLRSLAL